MSIEQKLMFLTDKTVKLSFSKGSIHVAIEGFLRHSEMYLSGKRTDRYTVVSCHGGSAVGFNLDDVDYSEINMIQLKSTY